MIIVTTVIVITVIIIIITIIADFSSLVFVSFLCFVFLCVSCKVSSIRSQWGWAPLPSAGRNCRASLFLRPLPPAEDTLVSTGETGGRLHAPVGLDTVESVLVTASSSSQHRLNNKKKQQQFYKTTILFCLCIWCFKNPVLLRTELP